MSRAFGSVQGPAVPLYATKALANLLRNLPGTAQRRDTKSPAALESDGEMAAGRDGAQQSHRAIVTSRKSRFLQANTCLPFSEELLLLAKPSWENLHIFALQNTNVNRFGPITFDLA